MILPGNAPGERREDMKIKYFVTCTEACKLIRFDFARDQKAEAIACFKNLALRRKDAEIFSIDSEDPEITYNLTKNYL